MRVLHGVDTRSAVRGSVALLVLLWALAPLTATEEVQAPHPGQAPYDRVCKACHGAEASGAAGPSLVPFSLEPDELLSRVREGSSEMPPISKNRVSDEEVTAIAGYLRSLSSGGADAERPMPAH